MIKSIVKFLISKRSIGTILGSLFLSAFMTVVIMMPIEHDHTLANIPDFRWIGAFIIFFISAYSLIVIENTVESYKTAIQERDNDIDYLKQLLFEKDEKNG